MALWTAQGDPERLNDLSIDRRWYDWYVHGRADEIEKAEQAKETRALEAWEKQLAQNTRAIRRAARGFAEAACVLAPQRGMKKLAWRALLHQIAVALSEGLRWNTRSFIVPPGLYVGRTVVYPYRLYACDLAEASGLCSSAEFEKAVADGQQLFEPDGALNAEHCGEFWRQLIAQLPPCDAAWTAEVCDGHHVRVPETPALPDAQRCALEKLWENLLALTALFAGADGSAVTERGTQQLAYFASHRRAMRGE